MIRRPIGRTGRPGIIEPQAAGEPYPSGPDRSANDDVIIELQQLADLKDRGVLSEQEFQAQKARILHA